VRAELPIRFDLLAARVAFLLEIMQFCAALEQGNFFLIWWGLG
jgi:hypothetical protein